MNMPFLYSSFVTQQFWISSVNKILYKGVVSYFNNSPRPNMFSLFMLHAWSNTFPSCSGARLSQELVSASYNCFRVPGKFLSCSNKNTKLGQLLLSLKCFRKKSKVAIFCNWICLITQEQYMYNLEAVSNKGCCINWRCKEGQMGCPGVVHCTAYEAVCGNQFLNTEHRNENILLDSTSQWHYFAKFPSSFIVFLNDIVM